MIKKLLLFLFIPVFAFGHDHIPENTNTASPFGLVRVLKRIDKKYTFLTELEGGMRYNTQMYSSLKVGTYRRLTKRGKLGVFVFNKTGQRHSDDWILESPGEWGWIDSSGRMEQELHLDYTYRFKATILVPMIISLKPELSYNFFNDDAIFIFTPTMSLLFFKGRRPQVSLHTKLPVYVPLNFEGETLYKYGLYQSVLYHFSRKYILGVSVNHLIESWINSVEFNDIHSPESYLVQDRTTSVSLDFILKI